MAGLLNKMLDFIGVNEPEEDEEGYEEAYLDELPKPEFDSVHHNKKTNGKVLNLNHNSEVRVVVTQPQNVNDAREMCDHLRSNKPIIINLEDLEKETAQRIVDFMSGCVYALDGDFQKVSSYIFLATPQGIDITGDIKDNMKSKGMFPWVK